MAKHPWLTLRGSVYYLRAPVPKDILNTFGKSEVIFSLRTKDRGEAGRRIHAKAKQVADEFEAHRRGRQLPPPHEPPRPASLDPLTMQIIRDQHYKKVVDQNFAWRAEIFQNSQADVNGFLDGKFIDHPKTEWYVTFYEELTIEEQLFACFQEQTKTRLAAIERALSIGDCSMGAALTDEALRSHGMAVDKADRLLLVRRLMETEVAALAAIVAKDRSRYDKIVSQHGSAPAASATASAPSKPTDSGPLLESLVPAFLAEGERAGLALKTTISDKTDLREFVEIVGNRPVRTYTKVDGTRYKSALLATPAQRKVKEFAQLTISKAAQLADSLDPSRKAIRRLHVDTINDKLMAVRKFFTWANDHLTAVPNPIEGLRIKPKKQRGKRSERRYPFRTEELQKLFDGPIFRGCKSMHHWKQPGDLVPRDSARFWAPLIALYTGMRLGEIIQLRVDDIKTDDNGITYFAVTTLIEDDDDEAEKSLKNANSDREVPIHPMLIDCGLQQLIERRRKVGEPRLFTDYDRSPTDGSWSKTFSAWFRHYRRHVGVERIVAGRNRIDFHSFRHVFEDAIRDLPDVKQEFRDALQGHGESGISKVYGLGPTRQRLDAAIKKLTYPGLNLLHLKFACRHPDSEVKTIDA